MSLIPTVLPSEKLLKEAFLTKPLFSGKKWALSPLPFKIAPEEFLEIQNIGKACVEFLLALETLYKKTKKREPILRNSSSIFENWVATYLEKFKPLRLLEHSLHPSNNHKLPLVLRPDLIITEEGFKLTEIDAVPGGVGLTAHLNEQYTYFGFSTIICPQTEDFIDAFYRSMRSLKKGSPCIAIIVSDESATYKPEFEWLAHKLQERGHPVYCIHPRDVQLDNEDQLIFQHNNTALKIDIVYRFFELFDLPNIPIAEKLMRAVEAGQISLTPPMRPFHEEKLTLALFHHPYLQAYWKEALSSEGFALLQKIIPNSWVLVNDILPEHATLLGPKIQDKPMRHWQELGNSSQKMRNYILKASGFHESAWGARSVTLGLDTSHENWLQAIQNALSPDRTTTYVLQDFHKPKKLQHPIYSKNKLETTDVRIRLCPYYLMDAGHKNLQVGGILATLCPADKKIIHGMQDAVLLPCILDSNSPCL